MHKLNPKKIFFYLLLLDDRGADILPKEVLLGCFFLLSLVILVVFVAVLDLLLATYSLQSSQ